MKRILPFVILSVVLTSCLGQVMGEYVRVGQGIPSFSVTLSDGKKFVSKEWRGKPCVIVFFNTKCGDCQRELPEVQDVYNEFREQASFVCISRNETADKVRAYWSAQGLSIPYSPQTDRKVFSLFAEVGIPRVYVVDASGIVRHVFVEKVSARKLRKILLPLCQETE